MNTLEVLIKARARIENIDRWTRQDMARDILGNSVVATSRMAFSFCAVGAVINVAIDYYDARHRAVSLLDEGSNLLFNSFSIFALNDCSNEEQAHARVLKVYDYAINREREKLNAENQTATAD